jgi:hypothetical protein
MFYLKGHILSLKVHTGTHSAKIEDDILNLLIEMKLREEGIL